MEQEVRLEETLRDLKQRAGLKPAIGLILGSGLGPLADQVQKAVKIPYGEIPHFPVSTVAGHAGFLVLGELNGRPVAVLQGRFHYYEGYSMQEITYPLRVLHRLGIKSLLVTNAAGGINPAYSAGDLMLIADHLNLMGDNPLRGSRERDMELRFPDLSDVYKSELRALAREVAAGEGIQLREGIYAALPGPSYETPAEINFLRRCGADAVGMSTVPEVIVAAQLRLPVLGLSLISNLAAGISPHPLSHREVMEAAEAASMKFTRLMLALVGAVPV